MNEQLKSFLNDGKQRGYSAETLNSINEERKKSGKGIDGWDQFYSGFSAQKTEPKDVKKTALQNIGNTMKNIGIGALAGFGVGKILSGTGKYIYKNIGGISPTQEQTLLIKEGRTPIQKMLGIKPEGASTDEIRTTTDTALERGGIFKQTGGNITRATTAKQTARRIWKNEVNPILNTIQDKYSINNIKSTAIDMAKGVKNKFTSASFKQGVDEVFDTIVSSISQNKYLKDIDLNNMGATDIQELRSHIMKMDIPESAYRGATLKDSYKQGATLFVKSLKKQLTDSVSKMGGDVKKFEKAYIDYGNLVDLAETSAKKAGALPSQNLQQMISSTTGKPLASLSTFLGKSLFKIGEGLQIPVNTLLKGAKSIGNITGKGLKAISPTLKTLDPTGILFNIIETEVNTKGLKGEQINNYTQLRLQGKSSKDAANEAKKTDINKKVTFI